MQDEDRIAKATAVDGGDVVARRNVSGDKGESPGANGHIIEVAVPRRTGDSPSGRAAHGVGPDCSDRSGVVDQGVLVEHFYLIVHVHCVVAATERRTRFLRLPLLLDTIPPPKVLDGLSVSAMVTQ